MWGLVLCLFALPLLTYTTVDGRPLDDLPAAMREISADPRLRNAVLLGVASIGLFNFLGLSVTKVGEAATAQRGAGWQARDGQSRVGGQMIGTGPTWRTPAVQQECC